MDEQELKYHCSFCGKTQSEVRRLIAGPSSVYICDECINLCKEIVDNEQVDDAISDPVSDNSLLKPVEIFSRLEEYIVGQDQAKKVLGRQGMSTVDFENRLKADLSLALIPEILNSSNFVPRTIVRKLARAENEKRTFCWTTSLVYSFSETSVTKTTCLNRLTLKPDPCNKNRLAKAVTPSDII